MIKQTIKFKNFLGQERTEEHWFHITKTQVIMSGDRPYNEIIKLGQELQKRIPELEKAIAAEKAQPKKEGENPFELAFTPEELFKAETMRVMGRMLDLVIDLSYGVLVDDGDRFERSPEHLAKFKSSMAYDAMVERFMSDPEELQAFITQVMAV